MGRQRKAKERQRNDKERQRKDKRPTSPELAPSPLQTEPDMSFFACVLHFGRRSMVAQRGAARGAARGSAGGSAGQRGGQHALQARTASTHCRHGHTALRHAAPSPTALRCDRTVLDGAGAHREHGRRDREVEDPVMLLVALQSAAADAQFLQALPLMCARISAKSLQLS